MTFEEWTEEKKLKIKWTEKEKESQEHLMPWMPHVEATQLVDPPHFHLPNKARGQSKCPPLKGALEEAAHNPSADPQGKLSTAIPFPLQVTGLRRCS